MPNARQKGSGVRIRSEAKAAAADRLLLAAQEAAESYGIAVSIYGDLPAWRWKKRRDCRKWQVKLLLRYMQAITAAQDVAKKGRYADL